MRADVEEFRGGEEAGVKEVFQRGFSVEGVLKRERGGKEGKFQIELRNELMEAEAKPEEKENSPGESDELIEQREVGRTAGEVDVAC